MKSNISIFGCRSSRIGDSICALPILTFLEKTFPKSSKTWVLGRDFAQSAQLYLNHPLIDRIFILNSKEKLEDKNDIEFANKHQIRFNLSPQHPNGDPGTTEKSCWWNYFSIYDETARMSRIPLKDYHSILSPQERIPKLEKWFDIDKRTQTIAVWCMAGYGQEPKRSPNKNKWNEIINYLLQDYNVIRLGHPNESSLSEEIENGYGFEDCREFSFFDQVKISLGCRSSIASNSGSSLVLGAYGANQITLLTNDAPNHVTNLDAFGPKNINDLNYNIITENGFDGLNYETVLNAINLLK